jgi:methylmalonyl-CoA/ethylmalonyl-CoA epimerase
MEERIKGFRERGFECLQSGKWMVGGVSEFAFFESKVLGTCFETIGFEEGWDYPEPDEWFPPEAGGENSLG